MFLSLLLYVGGFSLLPLMAEEDFDGNPDTDPAALGELLQDEDSTDDPDLGLQDEDSTDDPDPGFQDENSDEDPPALRRPPDENYDGDPDLGSQAAERGQSRGAFRANHKDFAGVDFGDYHALVIGVQNYADKSLNLKTPSNDARRVSTVLAEKYGFAVTELRDPTRDELVRAINKLRRNLSESDSLLIYYAGHGQIDPDTGKGAWLPADAEIGDDVNWYPNERLTNSINAMKARHVLVIADSCYSGSLTRTVSSRGLAAGQEASEYIRRMAARRSRTALTSGALEPVADGGGQGHSVFAQALLEALDEDNMIFDADELFDRLKLRVARDASQTPQYGDMRFAGHSGGGFVFLPSAEAAMGGEMASGSENRASQDAGADSDALLLSPKLRADVSAVVEEWPALVREVESGVAAPGFSEALLVLLKYSPHHEIEHLVLGMLEKVCYGITIYTSDYDSPAIAQNLVDNCTHALTYIRLRGSGSSCTVLTRLRLRSPALSDQATSISQKFC